jgi:hypothetical protein
MARLIKEDEITSIQDPEIASVEETPDTGFWEAGARGAAQGLTFDFADEITAGIESGLTGKPYDQALKESRAEYEANKEEYPITSFVGGLAGGIGQAAIVGGLTGGAGAVASGAGKLGKLKELTRAVFLPKAGESALKNIATAAGTGAAMSGITEIGASEKEGLERLEGVPGAALTGGVVGGALGGLVEGGKFVGGKAFEKLKKMGEEGKLPYSAKKVLDITESSKEGTFKSRKGEGLADIAKLHGTSVDELMDLNPKLKETNLDFTNLPEGIEIKVPGQGYIQQRSSEAVDAKLEDASERVVADIEEALDKARNIKDVIIANVPEKNVPNVVTTLQKLSNYLTGLSEPGYEDAVPTLRFIQGRINKLQEQGVRPAGSTSLNELNALIREIGDQIKVNKSSNVKAEVQKALSDTNNVLKSYLRAYVKDFDVIKALETNPDIAAEYRKLIGALPEKEYADFLQQQMATKKEIDDWFDDFVKNMPEKESKSTVKFMGELKDKAILSEIPQDLNNNVKAVLKKIKKNEKINKDDLDQVNKFLSYLKENKKLTQKQLKEPDGYYVDEIKKIIKKSEKIKKDYEKIQKELDKPSGKYGRKEEEIQMTQEQVDEVFKTYDEVLKEAALNTPLAKIDAVMGNILKASEDMGGITRGKSEQKRIFKVLDTLRAKETDSASGQKALIRYTNFLENLQKANPELSAKVEANVKPAVMALENQRFLEGAKLGESPREVGALRALVSAPLQIAALGGSLAAQVKAPRLGNYALQKMRDKVGAELKRTPNSTTMIAASKFLDNALSTSDEGRRAAILNTLNQYKQFRELFKDEEFEEK